METKKCIICNKVDDKKVQKVYKAGLQGLIKACDLKKCEELKGSLESYAANIEVSHPYVHYDCRKKMVDLRNRKCDEEPESSTPLKSRRMTSPQLLKWEDKCILCTKMIKPPDTKHPDRNPKVHSVSILSLKEKLIEIAKRRGDSWADEVIHRLVGGNDLVAESAKYHFACYRNFTNPVSSHTTGRPPNDLANQCFEKVCSWLESGESECELLCLRDLYEKLVKFWDVEGVEVYSSKWLKGKLIEKYKDAIYFSAMDGRDNVICFKKTADYYIHKMWSEKRCDNMEEEKSKIIKLAAKLIKCDITTKMHETEFYPTENGMTIIDSTFIPNSLKLLLQGLLKNKIHQEIIGQNIIKSAKPRSCISPIQLGLGIQLDHKFGSRWLIDTLHNIGTCISYEELQRYKYSFVDGSNDNTRDDSHDNTVFTQFVGDNVDHNIRTLDGKSTFHAMGIIEIQTPAISRNNDNLIKRLLKFDRKEILRKHSSSIVTYTPAEINGLKTIHFKPLDKDLGFLNNPVDILWKASWLLRFHEKLESIPNWSGYMHRVYDISGNYCSSIDFLPIINLNPGDMNAIFSTLTFCMSQSKKSPIVVTFDQPLWIKAVQIIIEKSLDIVARLGGFHLLMSFLGSVGMTMEGSGLQELFNTSYGSNAIIHMMSGKAYSRALRAHLLADLALCFNLIEQSCSEDDFIQLQHLYESLNEKDILPESVHDDATLNKIQASLSSKIESLEKLSRTAKLWIQYHYLIEIVKGFIHAERLSNWVQHLNMVSYMVPIFAATGHIHYAKSARLYLQQMLDLEMKHPELYEKFSKEGLHTVRYTTRQWSGIWSDLSIEQTLMRSIKSNGGLTRGRGFSDNVHLLWVLTMHHFASVDKSMHAFSSKQSEENKHKDCEKSRMQIDFQDFKSMKQWFGDHNPFYTTETVMEIKSLSTGLMSLSTDDINCERAFEIGRDIQSSIDGMSYLDSKVKSSKKVKTLVTLEKAIKVGKINVHMNSIALFSRLILLTQREQNIKYVFEYELTQIPTSLFDNKGFMRKSDKASYGKDILKVQTKALLRFNTRDLGCLNIIDGGWLLHQTKWKSGSSYCKLFEGYYQFLLEKYGSNLVIVFDDYNNGPSTKDHEHERRSAGKISPLISIHPDTIFRSVKENFLANFENKKNFIKALKVFLEDKGIQCNQAKDDADTLIVKRALESSVDHSIVNVVAEDTDVLVLLVHHCDTSYEAEFYFTCKTGSYNIKDICKKLEPSILDSLLFSYAWTGCDTVSNIAFHSKVAFMETLKSLDPKIIQQFQSPGTSLSDITNAGERIFLLMYDSRNSYENLKSLRYTKYSKAVATTNLVPERLPPTSKAAVHHSSRVYLQIMQWSNLDTTIMDPTNWGWYVTINNKFAPRMTDNAVAPAHLLKIICCDCKKSDNLCGSDRCSCKKNRMKCVAACGTCHGLGCQNEQHFIREEEHHLDDAMFE